MLYQVGALNIKCFNHKEIVPRYRALLATPTYAEQPTRAVAATDKQCRVARSTVYLAIQEMKRIG
jgi:hypothetical protein